MRLDDYLFAKVPELSKMYLRELVKESNCEVNGNFENTGYRVRTNDFVELAADFSRGTAMRPEDIPLDIVFEDDAVIVVNKPSGMLVHPTNRDKDGTLLNALTFYLNNRMQKSNREGGRNEEPNYRVDSYALADAQASAYIRPGLIHRLDKQTSGLMVVAKSARAHRIMADHFKRKLVEKKYVALVEGIVSEDEGLIEAPIGRCDELKYWSVKTDGKRAETRFWVSQRNSDTTLLELEPVTGRTNQLRIHCASIGHPIVGDSARGGRQNERLCLQAFKLAFRNPSTGQLMSFELPIPAKTFSPKSRKT